MKTISFSLFFIFSFQLCQFASSQNPLVKVWDYRFGGDDYEELFSLKQTADGGFLIGGYSYSNISGDKSEDSRGSNDYWIVKADSLGHKQWDKRFGGFFSDVFSCLSLTADGGYILGGRSNSDSSGDKSQNNWDNTLATFDYWVIKLDSSGNKQWDKRFGGDENEGLKYLEQTADHGYILGGFSNSGISGDKTQNQWDTTGIPWDANDYWIVKIDSIGNKEWDKRYGGTYEDVLYSVHQIPDLGYILGGYSESDSSGDKTQNSWGNNDYWIVRIDEFGNKLWDKRFGGTDRDELYDIQLTPDGGFILGGETASDSSGDKTEHLWGIGANDFWLVRIDSAGTKEWEKRIGGIGHESKFGNLLIEHDNSYLISGSSYSNIGGDKSENNLGQCQSWIIKVDSTGNKIWDKTVRSLGSDDFHCQLVKTDIGCYTIANATTSGIGGYKTQPAWNNSFDYWIVKFCDSTIINNTNELSSSNLFLFPNPAGENLFLNSSVNIVSMKIFDFLGKELFTGSFFQNSFELDIRFLSGGIYFLQVQTEKGSVVMKFIKE
jgi:hypothetical protein